MRMLLRKDGPRQSGRDWLNWSARRVFVLYAVGVYLLAIALLSPHAGSWEGHSFVQIARESPWERWWDWAAAWCSVKIMLMSLGMSSLIGAAGILLKLSRRRLFSAIAFFLGATSSLGFLLGVYYLVKALF